MLTVDRGEGTPMPGIPVYVFTGGGVYLGISGTTDDQGRVSFDLSDGGDAEFGLPDRQYKFRVDWEGAQYWSDPITIVPHEVNEIDMDLDLLGRKGT